MPPCKSSLQRAWRGDIRFMFWRCGDYCCWRACVMVSVTNESEFLLFQTRRILSPVLCNRVTRFMSEMSYGVYLIHGLFIALAGGWLYSQPSVLALRPVFRTMILTAVTVVGSYGIAWVLNRYACRKAVGIGIGKAMCLEFAEDSGNCWFDIHRQAHFLNF